MKKDRRSFIVSTGMLAGAAITGGAVAGEGFSVPGTPAEEVARLMSRFGKVARIQDDSSGSVQLRVSRIDHARMRHLLSHQNELPFQSIKVTPRNGLEVLHRGERVVVHHHA